MTSSKSLQNQSEAEQILRAHLARTSPRNGIRRLNESLAATRANERKRLAIAVEAALDRHEHEDTCARVASPGSMYLCSCWQSDINAALEQSYDSKDAL